jgi:thioredoxin 1
MSVIAWVLLALAAGVVALQLWAVWSAKRQQGRPAPDVTALVPPDLVGAPRLLLYFYGERCGPCRALAPLIDRLARSHPNLVKVDVARHPEAARAFRVLGTPTFVLVEEGCISKVILGPATERALTEMVQPPAIDKS